jgi:hypothetical protein
MTFGKVWLAGDIFDNANPVPSGSRLRATRTICKSPFPEEPYTYYFGGYDAARDTSNNTSWIYKGKFVNPSAAADVPLVAKIILISNFFNLKNQFILRKNQCTNIHEFILIFYLPIF